MPGKILEREGTMGSHVTKSEGVLSGKARIKGRRISVLDIVELVKCGYSREAVAEQLELSRSEVKAALTYYKEHEETMKRRLQSRFEKHDELQSGRR